MSYIFKRISSLSGIFVLTLALSVTAQNTGAPAKTDSSKAFSIHTGWGAAVKIGLNGAGISAVKQVTGKINLRAGFSWLSIPYTTVQTLEGYNLQADASLRLGGADIIADYYPFRFPLHFSGGIVYNRTKVQAVVKSLSSFTYGDIIIPAGDVGTISGYVRPGTVISPYIAAGYGYTLPHRHRLSVHGEIGTFFQGSPKIVLTGSGVIGPMASRNNTELINGAIAQYAWFPMLNILVAYKIL